MTVQNQRPGVYSQYDVASSYTAPLSQKYAAVVAQATGGDVGALYSFASYSEACGVFDPDADGAYMRSLIGILFDAGVSRVLAIAAGSDYEAAFKLIEDEENIGAIVSDATELSDLAALKASAVKSSEALRERIAFCGIEDAPEAIAAANALNCERIVLTCPAAAGKVLGKRAAALCAAALAGKILASGDAAINLNGEEFPLLTEPERLPEATIQSLLEAGVTVFESVGGAVECIRALTTRTKTNGVPDRSLTGINTILIIDNVLGSIRAALKMRLRGGRVGGATLDGIHSQVMVELSEKQSEGLITSFATPHCSPSASDPAVCVVELAFTVAHVISQIHVVAHIQV